ncbi:TPA: lipoprotein, PulS/OutS family, partial [Escherichia coli]|nr:lipoprotein, PulS/OutS family [Escherichia coli]
CREFNRRLVPFIGELLARGRG